VCTSYESNPKDAFDVFSLFPVPNFDYKPEIYKDYAAPIFRRIDGEYLTDAATFGMVNKKRARERQSRPHGEAVAVAAARFE